MPASISGEKEKGEEVQRDPLVLIYSCGESGRESDSSLCFSLTSLNVTVMVASKFRFNLDSIMQSAKAAILRLRGKIDMDSSSFCKSTSKWGEEI